LTPAAICLKLKPPLAAIDLSHTFLNDGEDMEAVQQFEQALTPEERALLATLDSPARIQAFLDQLPYSADPFYRCPLRVLRDRTAHCFDGALFAAAALRRLGYPPLIVNLFADRDDEHLLAIYRRDGAWGAVGQSNFVGLRFREAVYRTLRELVMSYFEDYYNVERERTLRSYTRPLNLQAFDRLHWMTSNAPLEIIAQRLDQRRRIPLLTAEMIAHLSLVDELSYQAGMLGINEAGLYRPQPREAQGQAVSVGARRRRAPTQMGQRRTP